MNRKSRRAAESAARRARKRSRNIACHNAFFEQYVKHLPTVPVDQPLEPGRVYHVAFHHDEGCSIYSSNNLQDCTCSPDITRHVEPRRS